MNKRKAIVCTVLFSIVLFGVMAILLHLKPYGRDIHLFELSCILIVGDWVRLRIEDFYKWLRDTK